MILLLIILLIAIFYWWYRRKYGVYLKGADGKVFIAFTRTTPFGKSAHWGFWSKRSVELNDDGSVGYQATRYSDPKIIAWKPVKSKKT